MDPPGALRRRGAARHACRDQRQVLRSAVPGHVLGQPRRTVPGGSTVTDLATPGGVLGRYARLQRRRTLVLVALAAGVVAAFCADLVIGPSDLGVLEVLRGIFRPRSEEHTSELQSLMRNSYAVFCLK